MQPGASAGTRAGADGFPLVYTQDIRPSSNGAGSQPFQILETHDPKTGEVWEFEWDGKQQGIIPRRYTITDHQNARLDRYSLKWAVDRLLPGSRQTRCHRFRIPDKDLAVKLSLEHQKSFFSGFEVCGSVWGCPICAPKIAERRRAELSAAVETAKALGYKVMLGTFTVPHGLGDDLKVIQSQLKDVWGRWGTDTKAGKRMRREIGLVGYFRAFEVTYGKNGWHPHFHALLILDTDTDLTPYEIQKAWYPVWLHGCRKAGLGDPNESHGVRVSDGKKAAWYVNKWGMESEITKGHLKKGKTSVNPWDLLRVYTFGLDNGRISRELRDIFKNLGVDEARAGALWLDFFRGFKGERQIRPSNGIRALLGLTKEKTDNELAEKEMDPLAALLATLIDEQRRDLIFAKKLPNLLNLAEDSPGLIPDFLDSVRLEYRERRIQTEKRGMERRAAPGAQRSGRRPRRERR
jgi:hypothetical protein